VQSARFFIVVNNISTDKSTLLESLADEVHVWFSNPDTATDPLQLERYATLLSSDERERHKRFHFDADRTRYLASHALVRTVLSEYTGTDPAAWRFSTNEHGRPEIDRPKGLPPLRFNLTHTKGLCACVVTLGLDCGIDAENLSRTHDLKNIAERMFAAAELTALPGYDDDTYQHNFFYYWTLREAYCKALGVGLAGSTKDYYFEIGDNDKAEIHFSQEPGDKAGDWQFALLQPDAAHVTAVAVHRADLSDRKIVTWTITP